MFVCATSYVPCHSPCGRCVCLCVCFILCVYVNATSCVPCHSPCGRCVCVFASSCVCKCHILCPLSFSMWEVCVRVCFILCVYVNATSCVPCHSPCGRCVCVCYILQVNVLHPASFIILSCERYVCVCVCCILCPSPLSMWEGCVYAASCFPCHIPCERCASGYEF